MLPHSLLPRFLFSRLITEPQDLLALFLPLPSQSLKLISQAYLVLFSSITQSCPILWDPMDCSTPGFPVHHQLLELTQLMSIELVMPSNHLILCCPLLLLPSIFPRIRVFSSESVLCIRWPKYWNFSFSISPSNEYSGLISFRMNWLDLLAVQGTLKSLLQHHTQLRLMTPNKYPYSGLSPLWAMLCYPLSTWRHHGSI